MGNLQGFLEMPKVINRTSIAIAIAGAAAIAGATVGLSGSDSDRGLAIGGAPMPSRQADTAVAQYERYIVVYDEAPLSTYKGEVAGLPAPGRLAGVGRVRGSKGRDRIDVRSPAAIQYVQYLGQVQARHERRIDTLLGRRMKVQHRLRHALNAVVTELTVSEAERLSALPEVQLVQPDVAYEPATDTGPSLVGAPALWNASPGQYRGEGIVIGILDTGINYASPAFAAVDESGYRHVNPLGAGKYLGTCAPGGVDEGRCNDKLIGGYDFICGEPGNQCDKPDVLEEPGFGDNMDHGSHVASIAAGNAWTARYKDRAVSISGMAPRANIVAFDVCSKPAVGGGCLESAAARAVDQAIADGVVDVLNFSISGGKSPWGNAVALSFLNATDAGIYVAAAAGNDGAQGAFSVNHNAPWVATTASVQHGRGGFDFLMQLTGPGAVPPALQAMSLTEGSSGTALAAALPNTTPLRMSPGFDSAEDGCAAYPAGAFQGAIAVIRRGTCTYVIKVNNAAAAGAVGVVVVNNVVGTIAPPVPGTTIPAFGVPMAEGNAIRDFAAGNGNTSTAGIGYPPTPVPNTPDVLAASSGRGPAGEYDVVKPDLAAAGVAIVAVKSGATLAGNENLVGVSSGTSMASPQHAGAAALVRQARPTWTVAEIKSALMMTAKQEVFKEDSITAADAHAMGAGRIQVDQAIRAGLLLNETKANFLAADPATGGNAAALNLPSMGKFNCVNSCTFTRTFRNVLNTRQSWIAKVQGLSAVVSPSVFTLNPGESKAVKVSVSGGSLATNGAFSYGRLVLSPSGGETAQPVLRLPIAVAIRPAKVALEPAQVALTLPVGGRGSVNFRTRNVGGVALDYQIDNTGSGGRTLVAQGINPNRRGFYSNRNTDVTTRGRASLAADDFTLDSPTGIARILVNGFMTGGGKLENATNLDWSIFRDVNGNPEGNPETTPQLAVWRYTAAPNSAGVSMSGDAIRLNLAVAGQNLNLAAGRYWLVASARTPTATSWAWFGSLDGDNVLRTLSVAGDGTGAWRAAAGHAGLAYTLEGTNECGKSWIGAPNRAFGRIPSGGAVDTQVQIDTAGLAAGTYVGYICVASNDASMPKAALRVALSVTP